MADYRNDDLEIVSGCGRNDERRDLRHEKQNVRRESVYVSRLTFSLSLLTANCQQLIIGMISKTMIRSGHGY
jgi:hypothetical protein